MDIWYRQSRRPGFSLIPVGVKGWTILALNLITFTMGVNLFASAAIPEIGPTGSLFVWLGAAIIIVSTLFFIYSMMYKADHGKPHDQNEN